MTPYYAHDGITIYHADARDFDVIPGESVITDPVWPNSAFPDVEDPQALLAEILGKCAEAARVVIHLGCNSDPRFLQAVPSRFKFFRTCWLEMACPNYLGRLLYTSDVAYVFGEPPPSRQGAHVFPGRVVATQNDKGFARGNGRDKSSTRSALADLPHPTPRKPQHVRWLVNYFGHGTVVDPFMGSGTTAKACHDLRIPYVGIERCREFCDVTIHRLQQRTLALEPIPA